MMLTALYELAKREGLVDNPDFEKRKVDLFLHIDADGKFLALEAAGDRMGQGQVISAPRLPKRAKNIAPGFLCDNAKYVLGIGKEDKMLGRNEHCAQAFHALVERLAADTRDEGAMAVSRFLERRDEQLPAVLEAYPFGSSSDWSGAELIAFRYAPDNSIVHERNAIRAYWTAIREREADISGRTLTCLVTGSAAVPARLHPVVKRIPGAQTAGATLVSFNADAFTAHGLSKGENAPVTRAAAEGYVTALNWLLEPSISPPRRFRYGLPVAEDAVAVFWTRDPTAVADELMELLGDHDHTTPPCAPRKVDAQLGDETPFYAATLSGNARVIVRDWIETTAASALQSLKRYFDDLHIGSGEPESVPLSSVVKSIEAPGRELPAALAARLLRSALTGEPFPRHLLSVALNRLRLPSDQYHERRLLTLRCGLIKATLRRFPTSDVGATLDESSTKVSYLLGRLFAVLECLQAASLGDINATFRERHFGGASTAPQLVFPRLLRASAHHAAKSKRYDLESAKVRILDTLPAQPFQRLLLLEEQGLFAVGYYHQRERLLQKKETQSPRLPPDTQPLGLRSTPMAELQNRYDFVLLFDVKDGNPNGDPDAGNLPRIDLETGHGLVTDVCLKRKVRNFVQLIKGGAEGYDIYVKDKAVLSAQQSRAYTALDLSPQVREEGAASADEAEHEESAKNGKQPTKRAKKASDVETVEKARDWMCRSFFDIRAFGAVMSLKDNPCGQVRGPIQLTFGRSIDPIVAVEHSITRVAVATRAEAEKQGGDNRTMGRKNTVPYGLYRSYGFVSVPLARKTYFSMPDLDLLWQALREMFEHDRSAARGLMSTRRLIVFKHDSPLGNAPAHRLFELVHIAANGERPARDFTDYSVRIDPPPPGVQLMELGS